MAVVAVGTAWATVVCADVDGVAAAAGLAGVGDADGTWAGAGPLDCSAGAAAVVPTANAPLTARSMSDAEPAIQVRMAARRDTRVAS